MAVSRDYGFKGTVYMKQECCRGLSFRSDISDNAVSIGTVID